MFCFAGGGQVLESDSFCLSISGISHALDFLHPGSR